MRRLKNKRHPKAVGFISRRQSPNTHPRMKQIGGFHKCRVPLLCGGDPFRVWDGAKAKNIQMRCPVCGNDFMGRPTRRVCSRKCARVIASRLQQERLKKGERV